MSIAAGPRELIAAAVVERAQQPTPEAVRTSCSLAHAERLLGREYHGRFLIELVQNAADAWRKIADRHERSALHIAIVDGPALLVANHGEAFPATAVVGSLGHIGASTKPEGEAIGHKGIGFKSVLEICLTPELHSSLQSSTDRLSLRFDPREAVRTIRDASPQWDEHVASIDAVGDDPLAAVPILRFPRVMDDIPSEVAALAEQGFDTVIRLPFDDSLRADPDLDEARWLATVRDALDDVTDQMLLLLGTFSEVIIEDRLTGKVTVATPIWEEASDIAAGVSRELVAVTRNGSVSSRWRVYRRSLAESLDLAGEIAVGMRLSEDPADDAVVSLETENPSAPFHLFFPTEIPSGLPLLLHGYFKVNAARTGFYEGSSAENEAIVTGLADLVRKAVADTAEHSDVDLATLVNLLGAISEPEDRLAREFRKLVLELLDDVQWVPLEHGDNEAPAGAPTRLLVDGRAQLVRLIAAAFPPSYIRQRTTLGVPAARIDGPGHALLASRRPTDAPNLWETLGTLCRPGSAGPWAAGTEDDHFRDLLDLFSALATHDADETEALLTELRSSPDSRLLPTVDADGTRTLLPINDPTEESGRSLRVMARAGVAGEPLVPPSELQVAFLRDGLLENEVQVDRAKPLGVRPFTVNNVLDRLGGTAAAVDPPQQLVHFLWSLLARERLSEFGTRDCAQQAELFDPSAWFWCRPRPGDADRARQQRALHLTTVRLPARDRSWQPAGRLSFGADWAQWLDSGACGTPSGTTTTRANAYRCLDAIQNDDAVMLAAPETLMALLSGDALPTPDEGAHDETAPLAAAVQTAREQHAFLLRLGVWEVIPVEGFDNATTTNRPRFPWEGPLTELRERFVDERGGWIFQKRRHHRVHASTDFRLQWDLADASARDPGALTAVLGIGATFYASLGTVGVFCTECSNGGSSHWTRYRSELQDAYPSQLALQLRHQPWVSAVLDGGPIAERLAPQDVWWTPNYPSPAGRQQSPIRYLRVCDPELRFTDALRVLSGITELGDAGTERMLTLLDDLKNDLVTAALPVDPRSSNSGRQAFTGLHRLAYTRLAQLAPSDPAVLERVNEVGVLCEIGQEIDHRPPAEALHDNGRFAAYRRHFGQISFVEIARDRPGDAAALGVSPFTVQLTRQADDDGRDVTDDLAFLLSDRIPELLAIRVHHGLGTQTLEIGSEAFEARAKRIGRLRVRQLDDLVIGASVEGTEVSVTIGKGSDQDLLLEGPTSVAPVLYHDLTGDGWEERLRRKIAPHLAALLESPAYAHTFALYLLCDGDAEREAFLQELGITLDDVDAVGSAIGIVSVKDQRRTSLWFGAIVAVLRGRSELVPVDPDHAVGQLVAARMSEDVAARLVDVGGLDARGDVSPEGPLAMLQGHGVDLAALDRCLRAAGDDGLDIRVAQQRLRAWIQQNGRRIAAVLATSSPHETAKTEPSRWRVPSTAAHTLDPLEEQWMRPVVHALRAIHLEPDVHALTTQPATEMVRLAGVESEAALDELVLQLFDADERRAILRRFATDWRRHLLLFGILTRTTAGDSRATIRAHEEAVASLLPADPLTPSALRDAVGILFELRPPLAVALRELLADSISATPPDRHAIIALATEHELPVQLLDRIAKATEAPRSAAVRRIRDHIAELTTKRLHVRPPPGLKPHPSPPFPPPHTGTRTVHAVKVTPKSDQLKRQAGDDAERWALAANVGTLMALPIEKRREAIAGILHLLDTFTGTPVDKARSHAVRAEQDGLDEDELVEELSQLLHLSPYSDAFGFDMVGWLAPQPDAAPRAMYIEVKGSRDQSFHLSAGEWRRAREMRQDYGVLVVRRSHKGGPPTSLDLLTDPVALVADGPLLKADDGYVMRYDASE